MKILFNKPYISGEEIVNISKAIENRKLAGDGDFTRLCNTFFEAKYNFLKSLLTTSCTHALEMSAILADIKIGDEVIIPSYTFVSTANAFVLRGAKIIFVDSREDHPGLDETKLEGLITKNTKAIVVVHYAGVAVDMDVVMDLAAKYSLYVIEDAAQAIDSYYNGKPLGGIGHFGAFSFHETKNIQCGEGGLLTVNKVEYLKRAEIIREKGTNRSSFFRGEVDKYSWVDIGSSYLPSEILSAFLYGQLNNISIIQEKRIEIWGWYYLLLNEINKENRFRLPVIPKYASNNGHMFYIVCESLIIRTALIKYLNSNNINCVFHYLSLHNSKYFECHNDGRKLIHSDIYTDCLLRLPMHLYLNYEDVLHICNSIKLFYELPFNGC